MLYSYATSSIGTFRLFGVGAAEVNSSGANIQYVVQNPPPARLVLLSSTTILMLFSAGSWLAAMTASAVLVWPAAHPEDSTAMPRGSLALLSAAAMIPC